MAWVPLVLASAGLVVTFAAGLWNIGIEGQIVMGAVAATFVARTVHGPSALVIPLLALAGLLGGLLWGLLSASCGPRAGSTRSSAGWASTSSPPAWWCTW